MSTALPKITVLMATFNREELVKPAIESFLAQTYENKELIICDDCSTDDTVQVLGNYASLHPNIIVQRNEVNRGFIRTMNRLFHEGDGAYVCILDSDDYIHPERLRHQLDVLLQYEADVVISEFVQVARDGSLHPHKPKYNTVKTVEPLSEDVFSPSGSLFMKREVISDVRGYHDYFAKSFCGDIYLINAIAEKYKVVYDPTHVYYYRLTPGSMTQTFNLKKIATVDLVRWLIEERKSTGSDPLEQGKLEILDHFIKAKIKDKKWAAEQFRIYASREVDEGNFRQGCKMLGNALRLNPFTISNARTMFYLARKVFTAGLKAK